MAVYDLAHRLSKSIKESEEYKKYSELRKKIMEDENTKNMLLDFRKEEYKLQAKQFSGEELEEEEIKKLNNLKEIVELNSKVKKYLEAEYRISILVSDLQRIIFSDLELGISEDKEKHPDK